MPVEHSAGALIFRNETRHYLFLLLHYEEGHWGAPKGHIERGETIEDTARREVQEETGLTDLEFMAGFKETIKYFFHSPEGRVFKTVTFLLARTNTSAVTNRVGAVIQVSCVMEGGAGSGRKMRPSMPCRKKIGMKATMITGIIVQVISSALLCVAVFSAVRPGRRR